MFSIYSCISQKCTLLYYIESNLYCIWFLDYVFKLVSYETQSVALYKSGLKQLYLTFSFFATSCPGSHSLLYYVLSYIIRALH